MQEVVKKVTHLLNELDTSLYNNKEESAEYLRENGYDPEEFAKKVAFSVKQTIAKFNREQAKTNNSRSLDVAIKIFNEKYKEQQNILDPKEYLMATLGKTQPAQAQMFFSNLEKLSAEDAISTLNDELLLLLIDELHKKNA